MQQLDKDKAYWFVLGSTAVNREMKICDTMRLQHFECYVPLKYEIKRVRNRQQEVLKPALPGLIFAYGTEEELKNYMLTSKDRLFFRNSSFSNHRERLVVSEAAMHQFMTFIAEHQQVIRFFSPEEIEWHEGELVRVTLGSKLYEGKIVRIKGKRKKMFALSIPDTAFATIELTPDLMQCLERGERREVRGMRDDRDDRKSKDIEGDKKRLFEAAFRLLFVLDNQLVGQIREYQVTMKELERLMKRLASYKGFTAATEGELALPLFMGAMVTGENTEAATERLKKAIERLKDSSMLKFRMRFYLAKLTHDEGELATITNTIKDWKKQPLQRKQKEFLEEIKGIF